MINHESGETVQLLVVLKRVFLKIKEFNMWNPASLED